MSPNYFQDTIVAQATPVGEGAIGIVRLSGPDSKIILSKIFRMKKPSVPTGSFAYAQDDSQSKKPRLLLDCHPESASGGRSLPAGKAGIQLEHLDSSPFDKLGAQNDGTLFESHHLYLGHIINPTNKEILDQVMTVWMKAPKSFTGEEMVEIHLHGGSFVLCQVLNLITEQGARLAEPGEFSKRAFLNGKIDLSQAEAIADLIGAKNEFAAKNALAQLNGFFSSTVHRLKEKLVEILAQLEAGFDFVEEDVQLFDKKEGLKLLCDIKKEIRELLDSFQTGQIYKEGLKIALIGKPNVGKSSLLNVLVKDERAITHSEPGTTRDVVSGERKVRGINTTFYDTAGIRESNHPVEMEGVKRSEKIIETADLVCLLLDSSQKITKEDQELITKTADKNCIIIYSKTDLSPKWEPSESLIGKKSVIHISSKEIRGIEELLDRIYAVVSGGQLSNRELTHNYVLNNVRHKASLDHVFLKLSEVTDLLESGKVTEECLVEELRIIIKSLDGITGEISNEMVLDEVFSKFCIGK